MLTPFPCETSGGSVQKEVARRKLAEGRSKTSDAPAGTNRRMLPSPRDTACREGTMATKPNSITWQIPSGRLGTPGCTASPRDPQISARKGTPWASELSTTCSASAARTTRGHWGKTGAASSVASGCASTSAAAPSTTVFSRVARSTVLLEELEKERRRRKASEKEVAALKAKLAAIDDEV